MRFVLLWGYSQANRDYFDSYVPRRDTKPQKLSVVRVRHACFILFCLNLCHQTKKAKTVSVSLVFILVSILLRCVGLSLMFCVAGFHIALSLSFLRSSPSLAAAHSALHLRTRTQPTTVRARKVTVRLTSAPAPAVSALLARASHCLLCLSRLRKCERVPGFSQPRPCLA